MVALATEGLPVFETKCEFPQGLKRVCENCAVPEGTRYFSPLYPGLTSVCENSIFTQPLVRPQIGKHNTLRKFLVLTHPLTPWANVISPLRGFDFARSFHRANSQRVLTHALKPNSHAHVMAWLKPCPFKACCFWYRNRGTMLVQTHVEVV